MRVPFDVSSTAIPSRPFDAFSSAASSAWAAWACTWSATGADEHAETNGAATAASNSERRVGEYSMDEWCSVGNGGTEQRTHRRYARVHADGRLATAWAAHPPKTPVGPADA